MMKARTLTWTWSGLAIKSWKWLPPTVPTKSPKSRWKLMASFPGRLAVWTVAKGFFQQSQTRTGTHFRRSEDIYVNILRIHRIWASVVFYSQSGLELLLGMKKESSDVVHSSHWYNKPLSQTTHFQSVSQSLVRTASRQNILSRPK